MCWLEEVLSHSLQMPESFNVVRNVAKDQWSLGQTWGNMELPKGPAMASVGPRGMVTTCGVSLSSCRDDSIMEVGEQWTLFGDFCTVERVCHLSELGDGVPEGGDQLARSVDPYSNRVHEQTGRGGH